MESFSIWHWLIATNTATTFVIGAAVMGWQHAVSLTHPLTGQVKQGYAGYCWTYLFLGWLVPVSRGEVARGLLHFVLTVLTLGIFQIVMPWLYNKQHMARLIASGWQAPVAEPRLTPASALDEAPETTGSHAASYAFDALILGQIQLFAFDFMPRGWMPCDGTALEIRDHLALYALLGTRYGGDGQTHFALPDLKGKEPIPGSVYGICLDGLYPSRADATPA